MSQQKKGLNNQTSVKKILAIYSKKENPEEDIINPVFKEALKK